MSLALSRRYGSKCSYYSLNLKTSNGCLTTIRSVRNSPRIDESYTRFWGLVKLHLGLVVYNTPSNFRL